MPNARKRSPRELLEDARISPKRAGELKLLELSDLRALRSLQTSVRANDNRKVRS